MWRKVTQGVKCVTVGREGRPHGLELGVAPACMLCFLLPVLSGQLLPSCSSHKLLLSPTLLYHAGTVSSQSVNQTKCLFLSLFLSDISLQR